MKKDNVIPIERDFTLTDILIVIFKHKYKVIAFFFSLAITVSFYTFLMTPIYEAKTKLIVKPGREFIYKSEVGNDVLPVTNNNFEEMLNTEIEIITSRDLAEKVVTALGIETIYPDSINNSLTNAYPLEAASLKFKKNLSAKSIRGTSIINVSFQHHDPQISAISVNLLVELFKEKHLQTFSNPKSTSFLEGKLETYRKKLEESEGRLEDFKQKYKISSFEKQRNLLLNQQIEFDTSLKIAGNRIGELQQKINSMNIKTQINPENIPLYTESERSDIIDNARNRLFGLQQREKVLKSQYKNNSRMVTDIRKEIQFVVNYLNEQRVLKAMALLQSQESIHTAIKGQLKELDKKIQAFDLREDGLRNLQRERTIIEDNFKIYLKKLEEARISDELDNQKIASISVIEEAIVPKRPIKPRKKLNIALGIVFGAITAFGLAFLFEYMDNTVRSPDDVRKQLGMAVLGMIPYDKSLKRSKSLTLPQDETHSEKKKYVQDYYECDFSANLVPNFSLMHSGINGHVLLVGSATSGEGKSTVLSRSAINLAKGGSRVVMVDADVQRPSLHDIFGLNGKGEYGLINAMSSVVSKRMRNGTLDKWSVDDLFFIISLKKQSGNLTISNDTHTMTAVFDKGSFVYFQDHDVPFANRLGTMLLNGGSITEDQLRDALDRNKRTGQPIGYILINAGYLNQDQLQGPLKLQMEEQLQKLFSWKQGTFTFKSCCVESYNDKKIHFDENYLPIISRLGQIGGSRLLKKEVLSYLKTTDVPNLSLLPAGCGEIKYKGLRYFTLLAKFLDILKQHYNVVLVDTSPLLETMNSVKPLLSMAEGVVFVIKPGLVSMKSINEAVSCIKESQTKIIGTVMNQVKRGQGLY